jgi:PilZ domain
MERRRRVPRQSAGWRGQCRIATDPPDVWRDCLVQDISVLGAGVLLADAPFVGLHEKQLAVRVAPPDCGSVSLTFVGTVRNVNVHPAQGVRIGIEFSGLSEAEQSIMNALEIMEAVW